MCLLGQGVDGMEAVATIGSVHHNTLHIMVMDGESSESFSFVV